MEVIFTMLALVGVAGAMFWLLRDDVKSSAIDLRRRAAANPEDVA